MRPGRVVVTGIGIICAAGRDAGEFWSTVVSGVTALRPSPRPGLARLGRAVTGEIPGNWITDVTGPGEADQHGRDVLLGIIAARQAMRQAGLNPLPPRWRDRTGLVLGKCQAITPGGPRPHEWIHSTADDIARCLEVRGPRQTVATACSAGSNAVGLGRDRLWTGDADIVLAGGVDVLQETTYLGFYALQSLDSEPCSPYSRSAGLSLGEGAAFLVLERAESAAERGARVLADVMGYGLSADAYHHTAPDPTGRGAALAVRRALSDSALAASQVTYVNGHGTGTKANDTVERRIMRGLFGPSPVPLTSTKSFTGHTLGAAGAIEAVTSVLSIEHDLIPPTVNFGTAHPGDLDFVPNQGRRADVKVVVSNSYAFGGNNASLVLARPGAYPAPRPETRAETAVITGIGLVGRPGIGLAEWRQRLCSGPAAGLAAPLPDSGLMRRLAGRPFAPPAMWRQMNGFTRLCMAAARLAIDDAGLSLTRHSRDDIGLILGTMSGAAQVRSSLMRQGDDIDGARRIHEFTQVTLNTPAGTVCQALAIRGVTTTITSGGASGTLALEIALDAIRLGRAEAVIVVAAEQDCPGITEIYRQLGMLGPDDQARPYDPRRPGTRGGTAAVALLVERPGHAAARQATPRGTIAAIAHLSDDYHPYRHDPAGVRYAAAISRALDRAGLRPADIDLVAGCATGTDLDSCEAAAIGAVFAASPPVTTAKSATAECEAASGLANVALPLIIDDPRPARRYLATSASFGATYGAVVAERANHD